MPPSGIGLLAGLRTTLRAMTRRSVTRQYPDVLPDLPPRSRGVIGLLEENCTVCMLCARECPDWCIYIDSHKEVVPARDPGARDRTRNVLDRFAIDFSLCMYCGICVEACPFDALFWSPEFEYAEFDIRDLVHEKDRLREWMWTVPPPPPLDPAAERPKEDAAARKAAAGDRPERPARPERTAGAERPVRPDRPPRADRSERALRPERPAGARPAPAGGSPPSPPEADAPHEVGGAGQGVQAPVDLPPEIRQAAEGDVRTAPDDGGPA